MSNNNLEQVLKGLLNFLKVLLGIGVFLFFALEFRGVEVLLILETQGAEVDSTWGEIIDTEPVLTSYGPDYAWIDTEPDLRRAIIRIEILKDLVNCYYSIKPRGTYYESNYVVGDRVLVRFKRGFFTKRIRALWFSEGPQTPEPKWFKERNAFSP